MQGVLLDPRELPREINCDEEMPFHSENIVKQRSRMSIPALSKLKSRRKISAVGSCGCCPYRRGGGCTPLYGRYLSIRSTKGYGFLAVNWSEMEY